MVQVSCLPLTIDDQATGLDGVGAVDRARLWLDIL